MPACDIAGNDALRDHPRRVGEQRVGPAEGVRHGLNLRMEPPDPARDQQRIDLGPDDGAARRYHELEARDLRQPNARPSGERMPRPDDKGQMFTHLKAVEAWLKTTGGLPVNVKIIIEGEEEIGGSNLDAYVAENPEKLACDYAVISDSSQFAPGAPAITYGLKGLAYFEIHVQGANRDLHSGTYGGAVANPINALAAILASLKGPDGKIAIPGFYDAVKPLEDWERAEWMSRYFNQSSKEQA